MPVTLTKICKDTQEYLNQKGIKIRFFSGSQKGGIKG